MVEVKKKVETVLKESLEASFSEKEEYYIQGHCGGKNKFSHIRNYGCDLPGQVDVFCEINVNEKTTKTINVAHISVPKDTNSLRIDVLENGYLENMKLFGENWEKEYGEGTAVIYY